MAIEEKLPGVWQVSPPARGRKTGRRNGPRLPLEQRREQLLDAAFDVVGREGLSGLTMQAVARQAGVAKPVLYAVYPTAPELVAGLLHREHTRGMRQVFDALPEDLSDTDPDVAYADSVMVFLRAVESDPVRWRLILTHADGAPSDYNELLSAARENIVARLIQLLQAGIEMRGGPDKADPELIGHVMLGFVETLGRMVISDPERFPPDRLQSTVRALIKTLPKKV
ncbi:putative transcriptional regulator, TetR family [Nocardia nova SH22a]|uniref:Putative transcriptional regulator, TetR family n=1 Tax=Nocardia nova SH22a TaxID=1415166 RepID=W5TAZ0_9NOCA|nr:TetR/AcrR family transcriptional regulator [Nocardia nova]AHH16324.1 putative transcriptional regulator, TetR family [Nocardia nova SH22a]